MDFALTEEQQEARGGDEEPRRVDQAVYKDGERGHDVSR